MRIIGFGVLALLLSAVSNASAQDARKGKNEPSLPRKVANQTVEEFYGFATGAIGEKKPVRALIKGHLKTEAARRGIELFTDDADLERFIDLAFAAGNKFGLLWQALFDSAPLGDATLDSPSARAEAARRAAERRLLPILDEKERELNATLDRLRPRLEESERRREALARRAEALKKREAALDSERETNLKAIAEGKRTSERAAASEKAEVDAVNAEVRALNALVEDYNRRVDETLAFLKTVATHPANMRGTREWAVNVHNTLAREGTVKDVAWLRNSFNRDTQPINDLKARISVERARVEGRLNAQRANSAAGKAREDAELDALRKSAARYRERADTLAADKATFSEEAAAWKAAREKLVAERTAAENALASARRLRSYAVGPR